MNTAFFKLMASRLQVLARLKGRNPENLPWPATTIRPHGFVIVDGKIHRISCIPFNKRVTIVQFSPSRSDGLRRLTRFLPNAGRAYAAQRNYDRGASAHTDVSCLSPYIRHRMVTEAEVVRSVLSRHSAASAEKFIQEVFWRTYWKGWMELRPSSWTAYRAGVAQGINRLDTEGGLRADWEAACLGQTGIDAFDHWAQELTTTGYLHNHARMWFASIWIFTLRLPWELGADFFLRHLLDGDPASNTLGWRWVAGLHTRGKNYVALADNIEKYTEGRFRPSGLAVSPPPLEGYVAPPPTDLPRCGTFSSKGAAGWLMSEEDLSPGFAMPMRPLPLAVIQASSDRSPLHVAEQVTRFTQAALEDATVRLKDRTASVTHLRDTKDLLTWAQGLGLKEIGTAYTPVGPMADQLAGLRAALEASGIRLVQVRRDYDSSAWPHATHGFFRFKGQIPRLIEKLERMKAA